MRSDDDKVTQWTSLPFEWIFSPLHWRKKNQFSINSNELLSHARNCVINLTERTRELLCLGRCEDYVEFFIFEAHGKGLKSLNSSPFAQLFMLRWKRQYSINIQWPRRAKEREKSEQKLSAKLIWRKLSLIGWESPKYIYLAYVRTTIKFEWK